VWRTTRVFVCLVLKRQQPGLFPSPANGESFALWRFAAGKLVQWFVVVRHPARYYELAVPDLMTQMGEQKRRRHRGLRLRRSHRMLLTALFLIALVYLTVSFLNQPSSPSSPSPEVSDDSPPVQFK